MKNFDNWGFISLRVTESQSHRVTDTQGYSVYGWLKFFCAWFRYECYYIVNKLGWLWRHCCLTAHLVGGWGNEVWIGMEFYIHYSLDQGWPHLLCGGQKIFPYKLGGHKKMSKIALRAKFNYLKTHIIATLTLNIPQSTIIYSKPY